MLLILLSYYDWQSLHLPISYCVLVSFGYTDQSPWSGLRQRDGDIVRFLRWPLRLGAKRIKQEQIEYKRKVHSCLSANRLSSYELFDDISLVLSAEVNAWLLIVLSVPRKCVIVWFPHGVERYAAAWLNCFAKIFCASHKNVSSVFRFLIVPWKGNYRLRKTGCRSSFSGL